MQAILDLLEFMTFGMLGFYIMKKGTFAFALFCTFFFFSFCHSINYSLTNTDSASMLDMHDLSSVLELYIILL